MSRTSDKLRQRIMDGERVGGLASLTIAYGYRARFQGKPRRSCPYKRCCNQHAFDYWMLGWDNADNDKKGGK